MRRLGIYALSALALSFATLATAAPAEAVGGTIITQQVSMTLAEPIHPQLDCPHFSDGACGSGEVVPLGHATEFIEFGAGCGGSCDQRTIVLPDGTLTLDETITSGSCPNDKCFHGPNFVFVGSSTITDVVVGGTGAYVGATGTLTGTLRVAINNGQPAGTVMVKLAGPISYDP